MLSFLQKVLDIGLHMAYIGSTEAALGWCGWHYGWKFMADLNKMKARLDALLKKARDAGSTAHEMKTAMEQAMKLAAKYGISEADLESGDELNFESRYTEECFTSRGTPKLHVLDRKLAATIGAFCGVKPMIAKQSDGIVEFFGLDVDVELALWIRSAVRAQYDADWERYFKVRKIEVARRVPGDVTQWKLSFIAGFVEEMRRRLKKLETSGGEASKALVVRKTDLVAEEMTRRGIILGGPKRYSTAKFSVDPNAFGAGTMSARNADIGRGVEHGAKAITYGGN